MRTAPVATTSGQGPESRGAHPLVCPNGRWRWAVLAAVLFLLAHLPFSPPTPDDIDVINFALGVREFDPTLHQPHPPGYPLYVAIAKATVAVVDAVRPSGGSFFRDTRDNTLLGLWMWSVIFGAAGVAASYALFSWLAATEDGSRVPTIARPFCAETRALAATLLLAASPLYWITAARPLSDSVGLAAATCAQAVLIAALVRQRMRPDGAPPRALGGTRLMVAGAFMATAVIGLRSQAMWLTLPLLALVLADRWHRSGLRAVVPGVLAAAVGGLAWAIPLVVATGGWEQYLLALADQGGEDFAGVDMLWTHFGAWRTLEGLYHSFVLPWSSWTLAGAMTGLALVGGLWVLRRSRGTAWLLAVLALPYTAFHLLFHETFTVRYALPVVPIMAYLAARGAETLGRRAYAAVVSVAILASLWIGVTATKAYSDLPAPVFRAMSAMTARAETEEPKPALAMHRRIANEGRRAFTWGSDDDPFWSQRAPAVRHAEWDVARRVLIDTPGVRLWFLAEPARVNELLYRDLALVDPSGRRRVASLRWPFDGAALMGGARPNEMEWFEVREPGWILDQGWALTPDTAGVAAARGLGPSRGPIHGLVRRRDAGAVMLLGGRHLGQEDSRAAALEVRIDDRLVASLRVERRNPFFLETITLPPGSLAGSGPFAELQVVARSADGGPVPEVAIEQFDLQDERHLVYGFDEGWQEMEYNARKGVAWRWMSERATVRIHPGDEQAVSVRLVAESPRRYFDQPSRIVLKVGSTVIAHVTPHASVPRFAARFMPQLRVELSGRVPRALLTAADGRVTLEASQFFVPGAGIPGADQRHLALKVHELHVAGSR